MELPARAAFQTLFHQVFQGGESMFETTQRELYRNSRRLTVLTCLVLSLAVPALASAPAPEPSAARFEVRFMETMIDHHHMAIMMAHMCLEKATHQELQEMCQQIIAAQQQEIQQMQSWLSSWYGISYSPQMTRGEEQMMEQMHRLSGAEFEIMFMEHMIRHHWRAIVEATGCLEKAYHSELNTVCENIITSQSAEITTMRSWLCQWYGVCNYGPKGRVGQ
jgi:uncharacterized protein (DUF305 family)